MNYVELSEAEKVTRGAISSLRSTLLRREFAKVSFDALELDIEPEMLIQGLLSLGGLSVVWGEPGSGKSFFTASMALAVATGGEFFGRNVTQGGVVYIAAEGGRGFKKRLLAAKQHFSLPAGVPFTLIPEAVDLCTEGHETEALISELLGIQEENNVPLRLVVIDTLNRVMAGGNENDARDMGALIRNADAIRKATGAAVLFVHHGGKDKEKKTRGHSSLYGAIDTGIEVEADQVTGIKTATVRKQKETDAGEPITFRLEVVSLGVHHGEEVTSCVVVPAEAQEARQPAQARRPRGQNALAFEALRKAIENHGEVPPACADIPSGVRTVSHDMWRRTFYQMRAGDPPEANKKALQRAKVSLVTERFAATWGDHCWVVL